jgi:predicted membrane-bound spermidine synthase
MARLVCLIFFLSGAAALIYETLWFRQAGLALGNTVWASSVVLAAFMAGLGLGNGLVAWRGARIARPLRAYAGLELVIAGAGLLITFLLPSLGRLLAPAFDALGEGWARQALRLVVAFLALLAPATAMGATLPVMTKAVYARDPNFGGVLGTLYGWNTLGAVAGALAGEVLLLETLGIHGAACVAAALGLSAAAASLLLARRFEQPEPEPSAPSPPSPQAAPPLPPEALKLLAAAFLSGFALLALEVVWFRFLVLFLTGTGGAFAVMLAVVLIGIAVGGLVGGAWVRRRPKAPQALTPLAFLTGVAVAVGYQTFEPTAGGSPLGYTASLLGTGHLAVRLLLPTCLFSGLLFTLQGAALHAKLGAAPEAETRAAGLLTLANTLGALFGAALGGFAILPGLGMERALFVLALLYLPIAVLVWDRPRRTSTVRRLLRMGAAAAFLGFVGLFPFGLLAGRYLPVSAQAYRAIDGSRTIAFAEGANATVRVLRSEFLGRPRHHRLLTNGYSMSGDLTGARRYMKLYVYLPMALQPKLERALLIGYGVGQTAKALTDVSALREIHVADPAPEILAMSPLIHGEGQSPLEDPRVQVHVEDGRFFLQTTDLRFDLITGEPPPPKVAGIVGLYTREHFQLIHDRLAEGGICTYWLPGHSLDRDDASAITKAFCEVFDDATLWNAWGLNMMLVGSRGGAPAEPVPMARFQRPWSDPKVGPELRDLGVEVPEQLGALFLADAPVLRERLADVEPLTDAHPYRLKAEVHAAPYVWDDLSPWIDPAPGQERFSESPWIQARWPEALREATAPWFEVERLVQGVPALIGGAPTLDRIEAALAQPRLRTLLLWQLGSSAREQAAVDQVTERELGLPGYRVVVGYHLGARAFAERDFAGAAERWGEVLRRRPTMQRVRLLRAYALVLAGDRPRALAELREARRRGDEAAGWGWLIERHGLEGG